MVAGSDIISQSAPRIQGVGHSNDGNTVYLRPASVVVQVKDPGGRVVDSGNLAWWTHHAQGLVPTLNNSSQSSDDWTQVRWEIASVELPSSGHVHIFNEPRSFNIVNTNDKTQHPVGGGLTAFVGTLKVNLAIDVKLDTLGTYVADFTQETRNNNGTTSDDTDDVDYSATGRYTFHVGPIAELEVRDSGPNPEVPAGQRAFTVVAVNNGPDISPAAKVTVTGLDATTCTGTTTKGSVAFASSECTWTIGELKAKEASQILNGRDGEILTIITTAAVDTEITAEIENTQDYEVCIDSDGDDVVLSSPSETACTTEDADNTWHTTPYYDYNGDNDSAAIQAKDGTGADLLSLQSADEDTASIVVVWDPVGVLNTRLVTHYEIEWSADGETNWQQLADNVPGPRYVDTDVEAGDTRYYRVRAVNDWDHKGPWSQPIQGTVPVPEMASAGAPDAPVLTASLPDGADGRTQIDLAWDKPVENGSPITSYTLEVSDGSNGPWAEPTPAPQLGANDDVLEPYRPDRRHPQVSTG